jgi:NitT/TauT family transport system ATP-binding protein
MTAARTTPGSIELEACHVRQSFKRPVGDPLLVLDDVNLRLHEDEIVALLGRSGCGKSTLLRIIAGLVPAESGEVRYQGGIVTQPASGIAIVFQTFALFPWLTVLENVQAGLDALGVAQTEARTRALAAIDLIGLDGFESAYPRELSGGMRQRVGFARAIVVDPTILLLDEPFSALDVLTSATLRSDFINLWTARHLRIKSVLLVTHNIEEAVFMADRILIMSSNPGHVAAEIAVTLPRPRDRLATAFRDMVEDLYSQTTAGPAPVAGPAKRPSVVGVGTRLPMVSALSIPGLTEVLADAPFNGHGGLSALASHLYFRRDTLFPITEVTEMMGFAETREGELHLTTSGHTLASADMQGRKHIFAEALLRSVPLASHIRRVLDERPGHSAPRERFLTEIEDHLSGQDAETSLNAIIDWGRYAEVFAYDNRLRVFSLENPH